MLIDQIRKLKQDGNFAAVSALIPYSEIVGFETRYVETGILTVLRDLPSNIGNTIISALHGGVIGALMEHAAVMQLLYESDLAAMPRVVNVSIDYLRPGFAGETFARGAVIKQGRRVANVRVEAWQNDPAKPVAAAHAHFLLG